MKNKIIGLILAACLMPAWAADGDFVIGQEDAYFAVLPRLVTKPAPGNSAVLIYDASSNLPKLGLVDTTLAFYSGGSLGLSSAKNAEIAGKFQSPSGTTGQYVRGDGSLATFPTIPSVPTRTFTNPARTLNTAFQISATQDAQVVYTVDISVTSLLLAGQSGRVILEYADNVGMTANVVTVSSSPNATGGVLNVTNLGSGNVTGVIPAGKYVRVRTQNVTGTPTFTLQSTQEVLL